ncbi:LamG-like jellyroll fold domain-containing protein [Saccharicrinis sp. FJH62]|uniref:LamG-like jellyroll fold domain-containing protein n=1 Tax=Saccharicrinis sp. FJH62 TaxID=3344657 RepID=UPI0035D4FFEE
MKLKSLLFLLGALLSVHFASAQQIDPAQVKTYLKFDDNLDDSSDNGVNFSKTAGTNDLTYVAGKFGKAGYFDSIAVVSSGLDFNPQNSFTIAAWVTLSDPSSAEEQTWIHQKDAGGMSPGRIHMELWRTNTSWGSFTDGQRLDDSQAITAGEWYFVANVKDAVAGKRYLYVNGVKVNELDAGTESNNGQLVLGARKTENEGFIQKSMMDELLITGEVLDETDLAYIMANGVAKAMEVPVIESNLSLKHSYTFEDGTADDVVGTANGTVVGAAAIADGAYSPADGNTYIEFTPADLALNTYSSITMEAYATQGTNGDWAMLSYFGGDGDNNSLFLTITRGDNVTRAASNGTFAHGTEPAAGETHHYVLTLTTETLSLYIDGVLQAVQKVPETNIANIGTDNAWIGKSTWPDPSWNGTLYEYNIYEGVMSEDSIAKRAQDFLITNTSGLKDLSLSAGTMYPSFVGTTTTYDIIIPANRTSIDITATPFTDGASVTGDGAVDVSAEKDTISVWVKNGDDSTEYVLRYMKNSLTKTHSYTFENGTADDMVGSADGTVVGANAFENGVFVPSDGATYIDLPQTDIALNTYAAITMESYVTQGTNGDWAMLYYFGGDGDNNSHFMTITRGDNVTMGASSGSFVRGTEPAAGETHHYVTILTRSTLSLYIDGVLHSVKSVPSGNIENIGLDNGWIGKSTWPDPNWNGTLYEYSIYNGVMDSATIAAHSDARNAVTLSDLSVAEGSISPDFSSDVTEYTVLLPTGTETVNVAALATTPFASVKGVGEITLESAEDTLFVDVKSLDGTDSTRYMIKYAVGPTLLMHSYTFEDGTADDMVGTADGTINGTGTITDGVYTSATNGDFISFDGTELALNTYDAITLETYIQAGDGTNPGWTVLNYFGDMSGNNAYFFTIARDDNISITEFNGGSRATAKGPEIDDGKLHHLVSVLTNDKISWYIDGVLMNSVASTSPISNISTANAWLCKGGWPDPTWNGSIYEYNIYNGAMDAATIRTHAADFLVDNTSSLSALTLSAGKLFPAFVSSRYDYQVVLPVGTESIDITATAIDAGAEITGAGTVDVSAGIDTLTVKVKNGEDSSEYKLNYVVQTDLTLAHSYTFDDGTANDMAGDLDAVINGTPTIANGAYTSTQDGNYLSFDGAALALNAYPAITLETYITAGNNPAWTFYAYFGDLESRNTYYLSIARNDDISRTGTGSTWVNGPEPATGEVHHYVSVFTYESVSFYLDGELLGTTPISNPADYISALSTANAWLGKGGWPDPTWNGSIHEFNIYSGIMDAATVQEHAALMSEASLSSLSLDKGLMSAFSSDAEEMSAILPSGTEAVNVSAQASNRFAVVADTGEVMLDAEVDTVSVMVTSLDGTLTKTYMVKYELESTLTKTHSYTFADGTADDMAGDANGTLVGGSIADGIYTTTASGQYIDLPAADIAINSYSAITIEAYVKGGNGANGGWSMLSYFGNTSADGFGSDGYFLTIARDDNKSRTGISCGSDTEPWNYETGVDGPELEDAADHHVVSILSKYSILMFIDGELQGIQTLASHNAIDLLSNNLAYICKGGYSSDPTWVGSVYEFNMYEGIMDTATISERSKTIPDDTNEGLVGNEMHTIHVYPSISSGSFTVEFAGKPGLITVYDLSGKIVKQQLASSSKEDLTISQNGVYLIKAESEGSNQLFKVVKTN